PPPCGSESSCGLRPTTDPSGAPSALRSTTTSNPAAVSSQANCSEPSIHARAGDASCISLSTTQVVPCGVCSLNDQRPASPWHHAIAGEGPAATTPKMRSAAASSCGGALPAPSPVHQ